MKTAKGIVEELFLDGSARISLPAELTPAPGQYLLAHARRLLPPFACSSFLQRNSTPNGFRSAPPLPRDLASR
jgi:hypothetical protein